MDHIIIETGVAEKFKSNMQKVYEFLSNCETLANSCTILSKLGFDDGTISTSKKNIATAKTDITSLLGEVSNCETDMIDVDDKEGNELSTVFEDEKEEELPSDGVVVPVVPLVGEEPGETTPEENNEVPIVPIPEDNVETPEEPVPENNNEPSKEPPTNNNNNSNRPPTTNNPSSPPSKPETHVSPPHKPFKFSVDPTTAFKAGDIFANDSMSLTKFTNDLLEKYGIEDEEVAKKIYEAVLVYGNEYYTEYQNNPLTVLSNENILSSLYELLKDISDSPEKTFWETLKNVRL